MKKLALSEAVAAVLILVLLSTQGCLIDPKEKPTASQKPPSSEDEYGDLTEKEHTIKNLVLSYKNRGIEKYEELLCADYLWFLQEGDYEPEEDNFFLRQEDIDMQIRPPELPPNYLSPETPSRQTPYPGPF